jgi:hypothetical protein
MGESRALTGCACDDERINASRNIGIDHTAEGFVINGTILEGSDQCRSGTRENRLFLIHDCNPFRRSVGAIAVHRESFSRQTTDSAELFFGIESKIKKRLEKPP